MGASNEGQFIGADVAGGHIDLARHGQAGVVRIANEDKAIARWLAGVASGSVLALESTGRYHLKLAAAAHARGLRVYVLNPRDVCHYARGVGMRGKTDRLDAQLLARYIAHEHRELKAWAPPAPELERLDALLRQRAALVRHRTALRQSAAEHGMKADLAALLVEFERSIKALEAQLRQAVAKVPHGREALARIGSVPGLGLLSAVALLRLFHKLPTASLDAVIAMTGLDPRPMDSGQRRGVRRLSKRGPSEPRRLFYNAAMSASRTDTWRWLYERERAKGLPSTAALIVLARKLVRVAFTLFKTQTSFDPTRMAKTA